METKSYYRQSKERDSNEERNDIPLCVNCCGIWGTDLYFKSVCELGRRDYYIIYLIKGNLSGDADGKVFSIGSGQIIFIPPHVSYQYENIYGERTEYLWLHFSGSEALKTIKEFGFELCKPFTPGTDTRIISCYNELFGEFVRNEEYLSHVAVACLIKLLATMSRNTMPEKKSAEKKKLERSINYIHENYMNKIDIDTLCALEHLSPSRYRVVFKECCGMSAQEYITTLRLTNACALLTRTNLSIKEIADSTGFSDQLYFSRIFAKKYKISPTVYRNNNK